MARHIESDLYQKLIASKFSFLPRGTRTIDEIYRSIKHKYSDLCDDSYLCSENCRHGNDQPEWKHTVRNALQYLKSTNGAVAYMGRRGFWHFQ